MSEPTIEEIEKHLDENGFVRLDQCNWLIQRIKELEEGIKKHRESNVTYDLDPDLYPDIDKKLYKLIGERNDT